MFRESPERIIDQTEAAHHVLGHFVGTVAQQDVFFDGGGARREHDDAVETPVIADDEHVPEGVLTFGRVFGMCASSVMRAPSKIARRPVMRGTVTIVGVVETREDSVTPTGFTPLAMSSSTRGSHTPFAFAVGSVAIEVAGAGERVCSCQFRDHRRLPRAWPLTIPA